MQRNVGGIDKAIRILIGLALLAFALFTSGPYHWAGLIGVVPILTAAIGWCPLYTVLGIRTCPTEGAKG